VGREDLSLVGGGKKAVAVRRLGDKRRGESVGGRRRVAFRGGWR